MYGEIVQHVLKYWAFLREVFMNLISIDISRANAQDVLRYADIPSLSFISVFNQSRYKMLSRKFSILR